MPSIDIYTKQQVDAKVPDITGANIGDVLTVGSSGTEWTTPSGGGRTITKITTREQLISAIESMNIGDEIIGNSLAPSTSDYDDLIRFSLIKIDENASYVRFVSCGYSTSGSNGQRNLITDGDYAKSTHVITFSLVNSFTSFGTRYIRIDYMSTFNNIYLIQYS